MGGRFGIDLFRTSEWRPAVTLVVKFETLACHETEYNGNNFIEVSRKIARDDSKPDDKGVEFISISRGYRTKKGDRQFKMHFTMPPQPELIEFVTAALGRIR